MLSEISNSGLIYIKLYSDKYQDKWKLCLAEFFLNITIFSQFPTPLSAKCEQKWYMRTVLKYHTVEKNIIKYLCILVYLFFLILFYNISNKAKYFFLID